jgi:hypothetical protein
MRESKSANSIRALNYKIKLRNNYEKTLYSMFSFGDVDIHN